MNIKLIVVLIDELKKKNIEAATGFYINHVKNCFCIILFNFFFNSVYGVIVYKIIIDICFYSMSLVTSIVIGCILIGGLLYIQVRDGVEMIDEK